VSTVRKTAVEIAFPDRRQGQARDLQGVRGRHDNRGLRVGSVRAPGRLPVVPRDVSFGVRERRVCIEDLAGSRVIREERGRHALRADDVPHDVIQGEAIALFFFISGFVTMEDRLPSFSSFPALSRWRIDLAGTGLQPGTSISDKPRAMCYWMPGDAVPLCDHDR
jgi:hypothetical protein